MATSERRAPHPVTCEGCRHSMPYATIINGQVHHDGVCVRPTSNTVWGKGCRHHAQAAAKVKRRK